MGVIENIRYIFSTQLISVFSLHINKNVKIFLLAASGILDDAQRQLQAGREPDVNKAWLICTVAIH